MKYDITQDNTKLNVKLEGELDTRTSPEFERALIPALQGITEVDLDLEGLHYISSAGLRLLLAAEQTLEERQGKLIVRNVDENVMDVFKVTGFDDVLHIV